MLFIYLFSIIVPLSLVLIGFPQARDWLLDHWQLEEYSHVILLPAVGVYLLLQNSEKFSIDKKINRSIGFYIIIVSIFILLLSHYGQMISFYGYALLLLCYGTYISVLGWDSFKKNWPAMVILFFAVPFPSILFNSISTQLQLMSSSIGSSIIRASGISVYQNGNIIDLGTIQLEVVEACAGLRYLFPLMTVGFIVAVFYKASLTRKWIIFLSSIPITIIINSLRIAMIAILLEYANIDTTTGFIHDFEGWIMFMLAMAILLFLASFMTWFSGQKRGWRDVIEIEPLDLSKSRLIKLFTLTPNVSIPLIALTVLFTMLLITSPFLPERKIIQPDRELFSTFPTALGTWEGRHLEMEEIYKNALPWNDYLWMDFTNPQGAHISLFIPYFDSLYKDSYAHNPSVCLPGNGWTIENDQELIIKNSQNGAEMKVNRLETKVGGKNNLVYYWFQHYGSSLADQKLVKPVLLWNSITKGRADGALVRLILDLDKLPSNVSPEDLIKDMIDQINIVLPNYVPD